MGDGLTGAPRSVVTIGDSLLAGGNSRRSIASRLAAILRATTGEPLLPLDLSAGGLRGAIGHAAEFGPLRPALLVPCLGWADSPDSPSPAWWVPDAEALILACAAVAPTVLVIAPPSERSGNRSRRWHSRVRAALAGVSRVPILDLSGMDVHRFLTPEQSAEVAHRVAEVAASQPGSAFPRA